MLKPEYLAHVSDGAEAIASQLHNYIIKQIVTRMLARLGRGYDYLFTATDLWQIQILSDAGEIYGDIISEISRYTDKQKKEIKAAMEEAGIKALDEDDKVYSQSGITTVPIQKSPLLIQLMERNAQATLEQWNNFTATTATAAQQLFIKECDAAYNKVLSGAESYTKAVSDAIERVVTEGVYVRYPTGHKDTIETAAARSVRSGVAKATGDISLARMEEVGWDIILVSAHVGARTGNGGENAGNHSWWQGKFYSRTGKDKRFPPFSQTGFGTGEGLCGWNCRHSFGSGDGINNPFSVVDAEENRKLEEIEQRQRELERRVRKTKRGVQGLQTAVDTCEDSELKAALQRKLDRKSSTLKKQNKEYKEYCKKHELKTRQERLKIARWNREQAAKARAAARRYERAKDAK